MSIPSYVGAQCTELNSSPQWLGESSDNTKVQFQQECPEFFRDYDEVCDDDSSYQRFSPFDNYRATTPFSSRNLSRAKFNEPSPNKGMYNRFGGYPGLDSNTIHGTKDNRKFPVRDREYFGNTGIFTSHPVNTAQQFGMPIAPTPCNDQPSPQKSRFCQRQSPEYHQQLPACAQPMNSVSATNQCLSTTTVQDKMNKSPSEMDSSILLAIAKAAINLSLENKNDDVTTTDCESGYEDLLGTVFEE